MAQHHHLLGNTGLRVSRLSLGCMTFGNQWGWGADDAGSRDIFACYPNAGGNFIDTADVNTGGHSETLVGRFIAEQKARDRIVLATKFSHNMDPAIRMAVVTGARISCARSARRCSG